MFPERESGGGGERSRQEEADGGEPGSERELRRRCGPRGSVSCRFRCGGAQHQPGTRHRKSEFSGNEALWNLACLLEGRPEKAADVAFSSHAAMGPVEDLKGPVNLLPVTPKQIHLSAVSL
ncbi:hypothetical protein JEQ12_014814 [Ovis aries]|uniref:Uncharacterized protein n=1 Tax=Ovis aries TaxID=9940 RepID=A0A836AKK4_SHEEP|nr:hypothetical protein JEQ12_014814 [Ovis aries]